MKWYAKLALAAAAAAVVPACSDSDSSSGGAAPGNRTVNMKGGDSSAGYGGAGNYFYLYSYSKDVKIQRSGSVNTSFSVPTGTPYLGENPRTISTNTTLAPEANTVLDGVNEILAGGGTILGDDGVSPATGLWVRRGATLTIKPNNDTDNADGDGLASTGTMEQVHLDFDYGILIEGTLVVGRKDQAAMGDGLTLNGADLYFAWCTNLVIGSGGRVDTSGSNAPAAGTDGGNGGYFYADIQGTIINRGVVDTSGGDGDDGGDGGYVYWDSDDNAIYNTGPISTFGGKGTAGTGGDGGYIHLYADADGGGGVFNSATLNADGGDGTTGGGNGDYVYFYSEEIGPCVNGGAIHCSGGDATVSGNGGDAGYVEFYAYSGRMSIGGSITARGGDSVAGFGGNGDYCYFYSDDGDYIYNDYFMGPCVIGANIDVGGGDGEDGGGDAGYVNIYYYGRDGDESPYINNLYLVGYSNIDCSGGDGQTYGGDAGYMQLYVYYGEDDNDYFYGQLVIEANLLARGGNGETSHGGNGNDIDIWRDYYSVEPWDMSTTISGAIDTRGGNGATYGGAGGEIDVYEMRKLTISGSVNCSGGSGGTSYGGDSSTIEIYSDDACTVTGSLTANGGDGLNDDGGYADYIYVWARTTKVGTVTANGGDGGSGIGDAGGDSGYISLMSTETATSHGTVSSVPGEGATDGTADEVWIDGIRIQ